jgi:hypothetical protein
MEKQLELKEASTRRKILALKQQLQNGNKLPATAPEKQLTSTSTTVTRSEAIPTSKSDQTVLSSNIQKTRSDMSTSLRNSPQQTPPSYAVQTVQNTFSRSEQETPRQSRAVYTQHSPGESNRTKVWVPIEIRKASPTPIANRLITAASTDTMTNPHIGSRQETKRLEKAVNKESSPPPMTTPSTKTDTPRSRSHQKLTLPEEVKETEYMSALQRQKARVSRIRRCIVAATVIQRAWRDYTSDRKGILS